MANRTYREGDTIVAPATAPGVGALAVIRISGPEAASVAGRVFRGAKDLGAERPRRVLHGHVVARNGDPIDEVLLTLFRAPQSFTGEDSAEISCHGAPYLVRRILARIQEEGARLALPGEFTRRAFANGRIDLAQAESVADLIHAQSAGAARAALRQLQGRLSARLQTLRAPLLRTLANVEADLDFAAEEEVPSYDRGAVAKQIETLREALDRLVEEGARGRIVRDGVRVVLAGRPNSGKSTLFNALLEEDRAIVSEEAGTTRDVLHGDFVEGGVVFHLYDTAGIREGEVGHVEREGMRRARSTTADLRVLVVDGSLPARDDDRAFVRGAAKESAPAILARNKSDLGDAWGETGRALSAVSISAKTGDGLPALRRLLFEAATGGGDDLVGEPLVTNTRHIDLLREASRSLGDGLERLGEGELLAEDLRAALGALNEITGDGTREEVLDIIFSSFCIGK